MNTKTMEGLVGARTNMNLLNTPFRVFKEARRRGDTETMERAMGYVNEYSDKADEYKAEADEGMKEEAKEVREKEKLEREKAIQKRKEECEKFDRKVEESREENKEADTVKVSEEGRILLKENTAADSNDLDNIYSDGAVSAKANADIVKKPVTYTNTGEISQIQQTVGISITV